MVNRLGVVKGAEQGGVRNENRMTMQEREEQHYYPSKSALQEVIL